MFIDVCACGKSLVGFTAHHFLLQGVLTPFERLDGYERKIQSGRSVAEGSADQEQPSAGNPSHFTVDTLLTSFFIHHPGQADLMPLSDMRHGQLKIHSIGK